MNILDFDIISCGLKDNKAIVPCSGYQTWTDYGYEYNCDSEFAEDFECDNCICVTFQYNDMSGIDPRTGKIFNTINETK